jgi:hypothetical protein
MTVKTIATQAVVAEYFLGQAAGGQGSEQPGRDGARQPERLVRPGGRRPGLQHSAHP